MCGLSTDTIYDRIPATDTLTICKDDLGADPSDTFTLCDGSNLGSGNYGNWSVIDGCLVYEAGTTIGADTICVLLCNEQTQECDTSIVIISVTPKVVLVDDYNADCSDRVRIDIFENDLIYGTIGDIDIISGPENGIVQVINGIAIYAPDPDFDRGIDSFTYVVCTAETPIACDTAKVIIDRTKCNNPPIAVDDHSETDANEPVVIVVLNNDSDPDGDPFGLCDGDESIIILPEHGIADAQDDGTVVYTPDAGFYGVDSFQYVICDDGGLRDSAWVYITINVVDCIIPQGISPNGDGYNDVFEIPCITDSPASLQIWNRWGSEVYRSENYQNDWDGRFRGEMLPDGTYYYVLKYIDARGVTIDKGGFVVIHR